MVEEASESVGGVEMYTFLTLMIFVNDIMASVFDKFVSN